MKGRRQVIVAPRAAGQLDRIVRWWQANRAEAPDLFADELTAALTRLAKNPSAGVLYPLAPRPDVRRILLPRTRYHVYYVMAEAGGRVVVVLAIWHAARGGRPRL